MWKTINNFETYEVSDEGQVRNKKTFRVLSSNLNGRGYCKVGIMKDGKRHMKLVHRLVMEAFNPVEGMEELVINHIDEDKTNNTLSNLEWCSQQYNVNYGNAQRNRTKKQGINQYDLDFNLLNTFENTETASKATGINSSGIRQVARGAKNRHTAGGYRWRYVEDTIDGVEPIDKSY